MATWAQEHNLPFADRRSDLLDERREMTMALATFATESAWEMSSRVMKSGSRSTLRGGVEETLNALLDAARRGMQNLIGRRGWPAFKFVACAGKLTHQRIPDGSRWGTSPRGNGPNYVQWPR